RAACADCPPLVSRENGQLWYPRTGDRDQSLQLVRRHRDPDATLDEHAGAKEPPCIRQRVFLMSAHIRVTAKIGLMPKCYEVVEIGFAEFADRGHCFRSLDHDAA